jgi:hypothetical protein
MKKSKYYKILKKIFNNILIIKKIIIFVGETSINGTDRQFRFYQNLV